VTVTGGSGAGGASPIGSGGSGGLTVTGGTVGSGGAGGTRLIGSGGSGGLTVTGGTRATGGIVASGGIVAGGGIVATGGSSIGGAGGAVCSNASPCGGDVVGTWEVTSSCLKVSGALDLSVVGFGCASATVTGSLQVTGMWIARADGTYSDKTITTGSEEIAVPPACLQISGTTTTCERLGPLLTALGYASVSCTAAASGGCLCSTTFAQAGGLGLVALDPQTSGRYTTSGDVITTDGVAQYAYCVSGNRMAWTPQSASPTTTGTIVFQQ
jgi:hypothetical protein